MKVEGRIGRVARRQHGLITREQVIAAGMTPRMIDVRLRTGAWVTTRPGIYAVAGAPATWKQAVLAACLAGGPVALASHGTALRLWGLSDRVDRDAIHLISPPVRRIRLEGVVAHRSALLPEVDLSQRSGVPCTTAARSIVETSGALGEAATGKLLDLAIRRDRRELEALRACVARLAGPGRRTLSTVREVLAMRLPGYDPGDSDLEVRALRVFHRAGFEPPVQQHPVRIDGRRCRIDLAYRVLMIAVELDGWDAHGVRSAFDGDRARRNELTILGWSVVQLTSAMSDEVMASTVDRLRRAAIAA